MTSNFALILIPNQCDLNLFMFFGTDKGAKVEGYKQMTSALNCNSVKGFLTSSFLINQDARRLSMSGN